MTGRFPHHATSHGRRNDSLALVSPKPGAPPKEGPGKGCSKRRPLSQATLTQRWGATTCLGHERTDMCDCRRNNPEKRNEASSKKACAKKEATVRSPLTTWRLGLATCPSRQKLTSLNASSKFGHFLHQHEEEASSETLLLTPTPTNLEDNKNVGRDGLFRPFEASPPKKNMPFAGCLLELCDGPKLLLRRILLAISM